MPANASSNPYPLFKLYVNDSELHNPANGIFTVIDWEINQLFLGKPSSFKLAMTDEMTRYVTVNDRVKIMLDNTVLIQGIIDVVTTEYSNESNAMVVEGHDFNGWMMASDCEPKHYLKTTDNAIINDILLNQAVSLGWPFFANGMATINLGQAFPISDYQVSSGKSFLDVCCEVSGFNNKHFYITPDGTFMKASLAGDTEPTATSVNLLGLANYSTPNGPNLSPRDGGATGPGVSQPITHLDIDNDMTDVTVSVKRDIQNAKSDILIYGHISNNSSAKDSLSSLVQFVGGPVSMSSLIGPKSKARKSKAYIEISSKSGQRPDKLHMNNTFRTEGTNITYDQNRYGSVFRRRKVYSYSSRTKEEAFRTVEKYLAETAPQFDVTLTFKHLVNLTINTMVHVKFKHIDSDFVIREVKHAQSKDKQETVISLSLPGRIV